MGEIKFLPNSDPNRVENHPSRPAYLLYRFGRVVVKGLDVFGLMGETAESTLADPKETRRYGAGTIGLATVLTLAPIGLEVARHQITPAVSMNDIKDAIDECLDDVEAYVPEDLQQVRMDECEAMFAPEP